MRTTLCMTLPMTLVYVYSCRALPWLVYWCPYPCPYSYFYSYPFFLTLLLLLYISKSFYSSLPHTLYSTIFLEFYTLLGDLVFGKLLKQLHLLKGLNSNIRGKEETGKKVLISLKRN